MMILMEELLTGIQNVYQNELEKMNSRGKFDHNVLKWTIVNRINRDLLSQGVKYSDFTSRLVCYISLIEPELIDNEKYCGMLTRCITESGLPFNIPNYSTNNILTYNRIDKMRKSYPQLLENAIDYITGGVKSSIRIIELIRGSVYEEFIAECLFKWTPSFNDNSLDVDDRCIVPMELENAFGINVLDDDTTKMLDNICDKFDILINKAGEDVLMSEFTDDISGFTAQLAVELKLSELYTTSSDVMTHLFGEWGSEGCYKLLRILHNKLVTSLAYSLIDSVKTSSSLNDIGKVHYYNAIIKDYLECVLNKEDRVDE